MHSHKPAAVGHLNMVEKVCQWAPDFKWPFHFALLTYDLGNGNKAMKVMDWRTVESAV